MDKTIRYLGGEVQIPTKFSRQNLPSSRSRGYQYCRDKPPIDNFNFSRGRQVHRLTFVYLLVLGN